MGEIYTLNFTATNKNTGKEILFRKRFETKEKRDDIFNMWLDTIKILYPIHGTVRFSHTDADGTVLLEKYELKNKDVNFLIQLY